MMLIKKVMFGDMEVSFIHQLEVVGCDEFNIYLADPSHKIDGLPYIRAMSKDWRFVDATTDEGILFKSRID